VHNFNLGYSLKGYWLSRDTLFSVAGGLVLLYHVAEGRLKNREQILLLLVSQLLHQSVDLR
jgi:hypothetical protein